MILHNKKAFTLVEILIVIVIAATLATGLATINILRSRQTSEEAICVYTRGLIEKAELQYTANKGEHSSNPQDLIDEGYLTSYPKCPADGIYAWQPYEATDAKYQTILGCSVHGVASPRPEGNSVTEDFDNGNADNWTETGSWWEVIDGKYYGGRPVGWTGENRTFFGDESWQDYTIELDANLIKGQGYGVYFRAQDPSSLDAYIFQYDPGWGDGAFLFRKIVGGHERHPSVVVSAPVGYEWTGEEKHLKIEVSGDTYKLYISDIDGGATPVVEVTDSSYSSGSMGLRTWSQSYASFDNIEINEAF